MHLEKEAAVLIREKGLKRSRKGRLLGIELEGESHLGKAQSWSREVRSVL